MTATIVRGDARRLPLGDESVDLIVTSPPYFALRSYTDGGEHYEGQIGSEATPAEYVAALLECTREWVRVLKPTGSLWVNLGDKYAAGHGGSSTEGAGITVRKRSTFAAQPKQRADLPDPPASWGTREATGRNVVPGFRPKSLMGMPWRYALACIDDLGLILRAEVIWSKPNGLPESVTDRVRRSHETWFHFTRSPRYFSAVDEIREPHRYPLTAAGMATRLRGSKNSIIHNDNRGSARGDRPMDESDTSNATGSNPLGKLPGSVWEIATEPLTVPDHLGVDHFAAFPTEWPRRIILGWSPSGICVECGEGHRPVSQRDPIDPKYLASNARRPDGVLNSRSLSASSILRTGLQAGQSPPTRICGYACACSEPTAPTRPAVVLDPFGGTGTTVLVASVLGRQGIGVDMSADYCRLAQWRVNDPAQRAKAMRVDKPPVVMDGQLSLLDEIGAA